MHRPAFIKPLSLLSLLALSLLATAVAVQPRGAAAAAIQYPAGWNLVAGPEGSHLAGASDPLYTLRPGDSTYETVPAASALHGGWGYWAYFPNGGSLNAVTGVSSYTLATTPGQWVMVGNPSDTLTLSFANIDVAYAYSAAGGYTSVFSLSPGQGAFVMAQRQITLATIAPTIPPAVPNQSLAAQSTVLQTFNGAVTVDGLPAPAGLLIKAYVGSAVCGSNTVTTPGNYTITVSPNDPGCGSAGGQVQFGVTPRFGNEWKLSGATALQPGTTTQRDVAIDLTQLTPNPDNVPWTQSTWADPRNISIAICDLPGSPLSQTATTAANAGYSWWRQAARNQGLAINLSTDTGACGDSQPGVLVVSGPLDDPKAIAGTSYFDKSGAICKISLPCNVFKAMIVVNDPVFDQLDTQTQARALAHEMGHALGLGHSLACDGGTIMWKDDRCAFPQNHVGVDDIASLNRKIGASAPASSGPIGAVYDSVRLDGPDVLGRGSYAGALPGPAAIDPFALP